MRVLVVDFAGHPFQLDLSEGLAELGHAVTHSYVVLSHTPQRSFEHVSGVRVEPVDLGRAFERYRPLRRLLDEIYVGRRLVGVARRVEPAVVLASNVPLLSLLILWAWCRARAIRRVLWLQDFQAGLVGLVAGPGWMARLMSTVERKLIASSDCVVAISEQFAQRLVADGVGADRVVTIENWAPLESLPETARRNTWSAAHGLDDAFVFLYSGTLGRKHRPELLKVLAEEFADDREVRVVVVGEGPGAQWLEQQSVPVPELHPYQPFEILPEVLGAADVLVVLLDAGAGGFSIPSKALTYLCAGRPILAAVPDGNLVAELVGRRAAAGSVVDPDEPQELRRVARAMRTDSSLRAQGRRARRYAERNFDRRRVASEFERVLAG